MIAQCEELLLQTTTFRSKAVTTDKVVDAFGGYNNLFRKQRKQQAKFHDDLYGFLFLQTVQDNR